MDNNNLFFMLAPPENYIQVVGNGVWRVCYLNGGKNRMTLELVGYLVKGPGDSPDVRLLSGLTMDKAQFEAYRRTTWPQAHEAGRNPQNTTLGVQSTTAAAKSKF